VGRQERETRAAERLFGLLPDRQGDELRRLWDEFEAGETAEAKLVRVVDQLPPLVDKEAYITEENLASISGLVTAELVGSDGDLPATETRTFDVELIGQSPGRVDVVVEVHLDGDPAAHSSIIIPLEVVRVDVEGGGCDAGGGGGGAAGGAAAALGLLAFATRRRRQVLARGVAGYDWMDDKTKARALEKRAMMAFLIGYPAEWKIYDFDVDPMGYTANVLAALAFGQRDALGRIGKPVDRNLWQISPATVNAYYHPLKNHMVFPAGILQSPFYSTKAGIAVNLGGMGMIVGHELTHGFDDTGSQFAGNGNMENWWEPEVATQFLAKQQCVIEQYSGYEALPGLAINGQLTLGENIADMGGVKLAFHAYRALRAGAGDPAVADGFSEDQQFFLAVGQAWCAK
jgi:hypothetical protein